MEFNNPSIDTALLPQAEAINLQPIERSYWKVLQLEWLITAIVLLIAGGSAIFFIKSLQSNLIIGLASGAWLLITVLYYYIVRQSFKRKAYALREKDALYRTGFIIRRLQVCPFNRIQHCSVHAGPLERRYGLASISLYTAGSEGSDLRIPGLTEATAASIREFIMQKVRSDEEAAR
ncbi:MAG TPA: PH domain-containing protein [Chitinophagaceae bacterium]|nr:PH domain-containing protein [Chitinophagaceae bacterium]